MAAIAQIGTNVTVGFNGITYTNFIMDDSGESLTADIEEIRDADNATGTKLISNKGKRYTLTGTLKSAQIATIRAWDKGTTLSVNSVNCMIEDVEISNSRVGTKVTVTVIKEASMTY